MPLSESLSQSRKKRFQTMKTDKKTVGFGGGFTDARTVRTGCRATAVLPGDCGFRYRVVAAEEDARPVLQHRTGASYCGQQMTDDSLAHMPRWKRWGIYALAGLTFSGILPMALATALIEVCDAVGWWLLLPLVAAECAFFWRVIFR